VVDGQGLNDLTGIATIQETIPHMTATVTLLAAQSQQSNKN
jgi:hypothetical protein